MNQKDIARLAGVSTATVSRVINNDPAVSAATAARVREILEGSGYVQNLAARNLRAAKSLSVAFIAPPDMAGGPLLSAAQDALEAAGYRLLCLPLSGAEDAQENALRYALSLRMDGVLLYPARKMKQSSVAYDIPVVHIGAPAKPEAFAVQPDDAQGMKALFDCAYQSGHRRIAFLHGDLHAPAARARYEAFLDAYAYSDLPLVEEYLRGGAGDPESEAQLCAWQLMTMQEPPTAILCADARLTMGCYKGLLDQGLAIPQDVSLLSFGDFSLAPFLSPPVGAYAFSAEEIGAKAAQMLLGLLAGEEPSERLIRVGGALDMRASCNNLK